MIKLFPHLEINVIVFSANEKPQIIYPVVKELNTIQSSNLTNDFLFVAFVEDNGTMSSIRYFENHVSHFVQNRRK